MRYPAIQEQMTQPQTPVEASLVPVRANDHLRWANGLTRWQAIEAAALARISAEIAGALAEWQAAIEEEGR